MHRARKELNYTTHSWRRKYNVDDNDDEIQRTVKLSHQSPHTNYPRHDEFDRLKQSIRDDEDEHVQLHQTVMQSKKQEIELQHELLAKQRAFIRHEKRKLLLQNALLESEMERYEASKHDDWFASAAFLNRHDRRLTIEVGGQIFELSAKTALKDPSSLLAAMAHEDSPISTMEKGCFRVDRDWWLFRYMLQFLRDGILPKDVKLLRKLYVECEFWKCESLRKAIEMRNIESLQFHMATKTQGEPFERSRMRAISPITCQWPNNSPTTNVKRASLRHGSSKENANQSTVWWMEPPKWWGRGNQPQESPKGSSDGKKSKTSLAAEELLEWDSWWKSSIYKGKDYNALLRGKTTESTYAEGEKNHSTAIGHLRYKEDDLQQSTTHQNIEPSRNAGLLSSTWSSSTMSTSSHDGKH